MNFNNLFNQTKMIYIPNQFICIYHINTKAMVSPRSAQAPAQASSVYFTPIWSNQDN